MSAQRLSGKVAIVTGSGRGIGRSEALTLAREGAKLVVSDFGSNSEGKSTAEIVAAEIRELGGEAIAISEDLMRSDGRGAPSRLRSQGSAASTFSSTMRACAVGIRSTS